MRGSDEKVALRIGESFSPVLPREHVRRVQRTALYISVALNVLLTVALCGYHYRTNPTELTPYARLGFRRTAWTFSTPYGILDQNNETERLWNSYSSNSAVTIDSATAKLWKLPVAKSLSNDANVGLYHVSGLYSMNCLKRLREAMVQSQRGGTPIETSSELGHCLDVLRQDLDCLSDDTPMYTPMHAGTYPGEGQLRKCRDRRRLEKWYSALGQP
ncbi:hypothetical protein BAUCODRAFT_536524 [Baudoinia panamericana UAMH 10762]|uniref:DUF3328 domain-containing protein n=1 Tax=Baudoinia panamericana (strain UAMH 10762) TaxID=717646 RepID=M2LLY6_BAUPA|nr:uncharacterized protein BAUCODRAFT_536524 [Baudoinia panamericana UAMH 10762]EMC95332.1 hypothetical protein BAUCODRAFT_536524 [Baudoinia panamericana UAMH 10762]